MAKPEWGIKRTCQSCGSRFYDMMRSPIVCPKCGAAVDLEAAFKVLRRSVSQDKASIRSGGAKKTEVVQDDDLDVMSEDIKVDDDEDVEDLIEDTSDLGGDENDMAEVIDHLDENRSDEG